MSKSPIQDIKDAQKAKRKEAFYSSTPVLVVKGFWTFAEGSALLITSLFALYQAFNQNYAVVYQDVLIVAGVLVLYPAALMLSRFFRAAGKA